MKKPTFKDTKRFDLGSHNSCNFSSHIVPQMKNLCVLFTHWATMHWSFVLGNHEYWLINHDVKVGGLVGERQDCHTSRCPWINLSTAAWDADFPCPLFPYFSSPSLSRWVPRTSRGGWCWERSNYLKEDGEDKEKEEEVNKGRQRVGGTRRSPTRLSFHAG